ncbi:MAG TPA: acyltransferase [Oculatellaceae cyanobacterium]
MPATQLRPQSAKVPQTSSLQGGRVTHPSSSKRPSNYTASSTDHWNHHSTDSTDSADHSHQEPRLDALTSLRFFAASMILLLHLSQLFNFYNHTALDGVALWQGVSFFFVLSGFILAYVYPEIKTSQQSNRFIVARFARVWPTHFAAFILTILLIPSTLHIANVIPVAVANLCMVHVWAFKPALGEAFNSVSWTISIELFFYLCFPFLIQDFNKPFKARWIGAALLSAACIGLCMIPVIAGYGKGAMPPSLFLGENPLCRLLEFTLGISMCWIYKKSQLHSTLSKPLATTLEIIALVAIAIAINLSNIWPSAYAPGAAVLRDWAIDMGGAPAYALLILVVATEKGRIAEFLKKKTLVHLGEISFSLYMYHLAVLYAVSKYQMSFGSLPDFVLPTVAVLLCLIASDLNFNLVETPCRKWILRAYKELEKAMAALPAPSLQLDEIIFSAPMPSATGRGQRRIPAFQANVFEDLFFAPPHPARKAFAGAVGISQGLWFDDVIFAPPVPCKANAYTYAPIGSSSYKTSKGSLSATGNDYSKRITAVTVAEVLLLLLVVCWVNTQFRFTAPWAVQAIEAHSVPTAKDITFGNKFKLRGLKVSRRADGLHITEAWQSLGDQKLKYLNAVQVIDPYGKTLTTKVYPQDTFNRAVKSGMIWEDHILVSPEEYNHGLRLGFSIYDKPGALRADRGVTDAMNTRLLVAIPY